MQNDKTPPLEPHTELIKKLKSIVAQIARIASSGSDTALLEMLVLCVQLTEADYGGIQIVDKDSQTLRIISSVSKNKDSLMRYEIPISKGIAARSARDKKAQIVENVKLDNEYVQFDLDTRSELDVPIIANEQVIGVLNLESTKQSNFTIEDLQLIEFLVPFFTSALQKSQQETKKLNQDSKKTLAFVLMPFKDPFDNYYRAIIKPAIENAELRSLRADEIFGPREIVKDIWKSINQAEIIIAELTTKNPNVMYELGLSHAIGKPVIMLSQNIDDVPFDIRGLRTIIYDTVKPNWAEQLQQEITQSIVAIISDKDSHTSFLQ